jgi:cell shape-determining protein MreC
MPRLNNKPESEEQNFKEELSGIESLLNFYKQVEEEAKQQRTHFFEDVSIGDNSR